MTAQVKISRNSCPERRKGLSTLRKEGAEVTDELAESGQRLYDERLRALLEPEHEGEFVAIVPESERYFLGPTGLAALRAGRRELPDKLFYLLRVGSDAAYHLGGYGARRR
jgi:hypothetical protein